MIRIAVCDDERNSLSHIKKCIEEYPAPIRIDEFSDGESLLMSDVFYAVIFLDIDMAGMNGIETARQLRKKDKKVKIIYVTNYTDYTAYAFSVHAFGYLLKPVKKEELLNELKEALEYTSQQEAEEELEIETTEGIIHISPREILYFEYQNRIALMQTRGKTYYLRAKITEISHRLKEKGFEMPHKSFVVNLYAVSRISGYDICLTDQTVIPLSQKKSTKFRKALNLYLSQKGGRFL